MLQNMQKEHAKVKSRLDVVGDPGYSLEVRKQINDIKSEIRSLEKEKSKLTGDKFAREKRLNKVLDAGQPDAMQETQKKVQEMTVHFDRLDKLNKKVEFWGTQVSN